jgi:hypothetical protein
MRQRVRKALVILAFLFFPITMNFFSPYVIIDGAMNGIVNGSLVMFGLMFLFSLFLGRAWCGWVCPGGGLQEIVEPVNNKPVNGSKIGWIKWAIWIPWLSLIVWLAVSAGGYKTVDLLYHTQNGISVAGTADRPIFIAYIIYYIVVSLFVGLAIFCGTKSGLPHDLLDGALHDDRTMDSQSLCMAFPQACGGFLRVQRLQTLLQELPDESGCECDGAGGKNGTRRMYSVRNLRG